MGYAKYHYVNCALQGINFPASEGGVADLVITFAAFVAKKHSMSPSVSVGEALAVEDIPAAVKEYIAGEGSRWADISLSSFEKVSVDDIKNYITDKIYERNERAGGMNGVQNQPDTLNILNACLLDIKATDSVVDFGTGFLAAHILRMRIAVAADLMAIFCHIPEPAPVRIPVEHQVK